MDLSIESTRDSYGNLHISNATSPSSTSQSSPNTSVSSFDAPPIDFPGISRKQLTIGVEIEMVIPRLEEEKRFQGDCFHFLAQPLKVLAEDMETGIIIDEPWSQRFDLFQVKSDYTIQGKNTTDALIEIATPILRYEDWNWVIPRVCESMRSAAQFAGTRLSFNRTTGLHVHIAISNRPFTFPELKRISKAHLIFENHMSHFHPVCRRESSSCYDIFRIDSCHTSKPLRGLSYEEAFVLIDKASSLDDIIYNLNGIGTSVATAGGEPILKFPGRYFKCNFTALFRYGTIEFREAMGTDDEAFILDWIKTITKFIMAAVRTPDQLFVDWVRNGIPPVVYSVYGVPRPPGYRRWSKCSPNQAPARKTFAPRYGRK